MNDDDLLRPGWASRHVRANGIALHVVEAGPADGRPLLLLHGFPEFWWAWRKQIGPLAEAGYRVIVPDLRGYNLSDAPSGLGAYHIDVLAADVVALAAAMGVDRFDLVGHDWGGVIAWWVAARHGERLRRLVILDAPHPHVLARQARKHPRQALRSSYVLFFQLPSLPEAMLGAFDFAALKRGMRRSAAPGTFDGGELRRYAEAWARPVRLTAMLNYYRALRHRRADVPARIPVPTLLLWGEKDSFLEQHVARASAALCDDVRLELVRGATHWLHLEQPERVAALISGGWSASGGRAAAD